jgi:hypothetical protein
MSGFIVAAFAGLLIQQAEPHPSTRSLYQAPAIRPFEPPSDFGRETAQGDGDAVLHRRPLEAPVTVERYVRTYEFTPTDLEAAYEQGVTSAELRMDQTAGPLDGAWTVTDERGRALFALVVSDRGALAEGGWRGDAGSGAVTRDGSRLTLEGLGVLALEADRPGWRGVLTASDGSPRSVVVSPAN